MSTSPHIVEVSRDNFSSVVIEGSRKQPVLVDFWADWCQPCQMLIPILSRLAEEYAGGFLLAKVNTDQEQELAMEYGVRSLPTVMLFSNGEAVDQFMGVQPESAVRELLEGHLPGPESEALQAGRDALEQGDAQTALAHFEAARQARPEKEALKIDQARALLMLGRADEAQALVKSLPMDLYEQEAVKRIESQLHFAHIAGDPAELPGWEARLADQPDDPEALHRVAASRILQGDHEQGLELLLRLMKKHRAYGDDAGHKGLLAAFELLGARHPLVNEYRRRMMALMF
ncbi:MAG: thioredoxin [Ectothiorhodospira sp.]